MLEIGGIYGLDIDLAATLLLQKYDIDVAKHQARLTANEIRIMLFGDGDRNQPAESGTRQEIRV